MTFVLSTQNVFEYLIERRLCKPEELAPDKIELKVAKNFNLLVTLSDQRQLLVKQERFGQPRKTAGEFLNEWYIQQFLQQFPELNMVQPMLPEVLAFDPENQIIVMNYLTEYQDAHAFHRQQRQFPAAIATRLGQMLATVHRTTFRQPAYQLFFAQKQPEDPAYRVIGTVQKLEQITPEIFSITPPDGIKFLVLYQRYPALGEAVASLSQQFQPSCLTHNDYKLSNVLLHQDWQNHTTSETLPDLLPELRLIDWERCAWGDPTVDLGFMIASHLHFWLDSLIVSQSMPIETSLRLANCPLHQLHPAIRAFLTSYIAIFPEILVQDSNFFNKVGQFTGLALLHQIQAMIQYSKSFDNTEICTLQVAKSLLCRPERSLSSLLGISITELINTCPALVSI